MLRSPQPCEFARKSNEYIPDAADDGADGAPPPQAAACKATSVAAVRASRHPRFRTLRGTPWHARRFYTSDVLETVFLDAGGVLIFPSWTRISDALARRRVLVDPAALAAAEPHAKKQIDTGEVIRATNDTTRGWAYFNLVLTCAGVTLTEATAEALAELHEYHQAHNLWESVPADVPDALAALRARGLRLVVVSNANGTLHRAFDRLGLTPRVDVVLDSFVEGIEKPDPRFFEIALARSGASAPTTIHVGDIYHVDVVGARAAGLRPVLVDSAGLYPDADCPRIARLAELPALLQSAL